MNLISNPLVRIGLAAVAAQYLAPPLINRAIVPELNKADEQRNQMVILGGMVIATVGAYAAIGMIK